MSAKDQVEAIVLENMDEFPTFDDCPYHYGSMLTEAIEEVAKYPTQATIYHILDPDELSDHSSRRMYAEYVANLVKHRVNVPELAASPKNLLNAPEDDATWQDRYRHVMALFVAEHGQPVKLSNGYYGWVDFDYLQVNPKPVVAVILNVKEDYWEEFEGTFVTDVDSHVGVIADAIFMDGSQRRIRWEGDMSTIIRGITK